MDEQRFAAFLALRRLPDGVPAYEGLVRGIKSLVMEGHIPTGSRLPSERALADTLQLSRTTVSHAYHELAESGWTRARQGSGTVISLPVADRPPTRPLIPGSGDGDIDLASAAGLAPEGLADLISQALQWLPRAFTSTGYEPLGAKFLRDRIAAWHTAQGLPTAADQIVVTSGALAALNVSLQALVGPGSHMVIDSPSYPGAIAATRTTRTRLTPIALGDDGWNLTQWGDAVRRKKPSAAYLIPDFHNPTGQLMPSEVRAELARMCERGGCVPIVDETTRPLNFDHTEMPKPFASFTSTAITLGSVAKSLWGGVRVGWIRCPDSMINTIREQHLRTSFGASIIDQLIATSFLDNPAPILGKTLANMRDTRNEWITQLSAQCPDWRIPDVTGGLALWVQLPQPLSSQLAISAINHGLDIICGPSFSPDHTHTNRIRLPLTLPHLVIPDVAERLSAAWHDTVTQELRMQQTPFTP